MPEFPKNLSIQYVSSHENAFGDEEHGLLKPQEYMAAIVQQKLSTLTDEIEKIEDSQEQGGNDGDVEEIANRLAELHGTQEDLEASSASEFQQTIETLGFKTLLEHPVSQLSCGWRYKSRLVAAFTSCSDILIIDEL